MRFADAPRLYRVAMSLSVRTPAGIEKRETTIVLQRQGIARIVGEQPALPALSDLELPDLDDAGLPDLLPQSS